MDRDRRNRFEDGEVIRYGAGESWRPTPRDRSPRRPRSPPPRDRDRDRDRDRPRDPRDLRDRDRPRSPPMASDSYVPRSPRRRSRSGDRFRRERSRGADTWRRRERSRSPPPPRRPSPGRRPSPRRHSPRRMSPRRGSIGRRSPIGRSPAWRDNRPRSPIRDRPFDRRDDRRRSRSPFLRDRPFPDRSPRRSPAPRGNFRGRSRSASRRGSERYPPASFRRSPPPRDNFVPSAMTSQSASGRSSPHHQPPRPRSRQQSRETSPMRVTPTAPVVAREPPRPAAQEAPAPPSRTPPRGPAALRAPPTGPSTGRNFTAPAASPSVQPPRHAQTPGGTPSRADAASPSVPPSGPRGYVPNPRGGFGARGGRGGWSGPSRHTPMPSPGPSTVAGGANAIPTGPRAGSTGSVPTTPSSTSKPFNPPTGPSSQHGAGRMTLSQSLLASMPPLVPGGKIDPAMLPTTIGVTKELEPHYRKLKAEEERLRADLDVKQDRLRQSLAAWDKLELEAKAWKTRVDFNEQAMNGLAGDDLGGAAF